MLDEKAPLTPAQRVDIIDRCKKLIAESDYTQASIGRELGVSSSTMSDLLRNEWKGETGNRHIARLHNWMELAARRRGLLHSKRFVTTSVARAILTVARIVAESCKMGVVFGPSHIGKSFTLEAIEGEQTYGSPVLITVKEWIVRPLPLVREMCSRFDLSVHGTFDVLARTPGRTADRHEADADLRRSGPA